MFNSPWENEKKNIFSFLADDHSRVILSGGEDNDYINASFIDVSSRLI